MVFRHAWEMPMEWKCRFCNYIFPSKDRPGSCPFCHKKSNIEVFNEDMRFSMTEMD